MRETKRVYIYTETKEEIINWAEEHDAELPYVCKNNKHTFPQLLELYIGYLKNGGVI